MKLSTYIRYWFYIIFFYVLWARTLGYLFFSIAYIFRHKISETNWKFLWWHLTDEKSLFGDSYFKEWMKPNFLKAFLWYNRNVIQNYKYTHKVNGKQTNLKGWETCQRDNAARMWRTPKTKDITGLFQDKIGKYMDFERGIYGKQRIIFDIDDKQYFRNSGAVPRKMWGNLYWIFAYKVGFDSTFWDIQFQPFTFKRLVKGEMFKFKKYSYE